MTFLDELREKRRKFLVGLDANKDDINLDIFDDFYPDKAHFVLELLQNAEDAEATICRFSLLKDKCLFEHNGRRQFDERDVRAITGIHNSTKSGSSDQIGKFGIGFKSVFIYSRSPRIYSQKFSFRIIKLVMPEAIPSDPYIGNLTKFTLEFDNSSKSKRDAFAEIQAGLERLSPSTLLFLTNIESVIWQIESVPEQRISRIEHTEHHIETQIKRGDRVTTSAHYLRFYRPIEELEKQHAAVAFKLDAVRSASEFDATKSLAEQFCIVPERGRVAVFFPTEKETSGLRFHLHAPFVPELSRSSVKDTPENTPLFGHLAKLVAGSLHTVRDLGLLNADFLAVLPNPNDTLSGRYECIRDAIVDAMNGQSLTPTYWNNHAPAKQLLQAGSPLKVLLDEQDIEFLVDSEGSSLTWAIRATQRNSDIDRFLSGLAIRVWDAENFISLLIQRLSRYGWVYAKRPMRHGGSDPEFLRWLGSKSDDWHQKLYALLYRELEQKNAVARVNNLYIVRLSSTEYGIGHQCYFPTEEVHEDPFLPRVAMATYTSGKSKADQRSARNFLEAIGVREVGEREEVETILKQRYSKKSEIPDKRTYKNDLMRFISLVHDDPKAATIFKDYWIFERADGDWEQPSQVYLDIPFLETGLHYYYKSLGSKTRLAALSDSYITFGIPLTKIVDFAKAVGIGVSLVIEKQGTGGHQLGESLHQDYGARWTKTRIDSDWTINNLEEVFEKPFRELSRLIWHTMIKADKRVLEAKFRPNQQYVTRGEPSSLVLTLRQMRWVPQKNGYSRPAEASQSLLPEGFPFDSGWSWLKAVRFGAESAKRNEERRKEQYLAKELGFSDDEALRDAKRFAQLPRDIRRTILENQEVTDTTDLPDDEPNKPEQRARQVSEQAKNAPERVTEKRSRSVSVNRDAVKEDARPYLRQRYTNLDGIMICQVCKKSLPFTLSDGSYFFEAVEFLPELEKHYYQNYLTLCPNHAAMYQHANDDAERMKDLFLDLAGNELEVILAREDTTIYFTKTHMVDLRTVIASED